MQCPVSCLLIIIVRSKAFIKSILWNCYLSALIVLLVNLLNSIAYGHGRWSHLSYIWSSHESKICYMPIWGFNSMCCTQEAATLAQ